MYHIYCSYYNKYLGNKNRVNYCSCTSLRLLLNYSYMYFNYVLFSMQQWNKTNKELYRTPKIKWKVREDDLKIMSCINFVHFNVIYTEMTCEKITRNNKSDWPRNELTMKSKQCKLVKILQWLQAGDIIHVAGVLNHSIIKLSKQTHKELYCTRWHNENY